MCAASLDRVSCWCETQVYDHLKSQRKPSGLHGLHGEVRPVRRFAPYGGILSVKVLQEQKSGKCRGVCFVNYMEPQGAASAIQSLDGIRLAGRFLQVKLQGKRR